MKQIKCYGTLGPACADTALLAEMLRQGMAGVRLNLSHGMLAQRQAWIEQLFAAGASVGVSPELIIDTRGPELRVLGLEKELNLPAGTVFTLNEDFRVPLRLIEVLVSGDSLLLDDGKLLASVEEVCASAGQARCRVVRGGVLKPGKSVAAVGKTVDMPALTQEDLINIADAKKFGVTGLMQPFVRSGADLAAVRRALDDAGCDSVKIFAKIEDCNGLRRLHELMDYADCIVVARGDLGNSLGLVNIPAAQKYIAAECAAAGKSCMVATQLLSSMETNPVPLRAEISDMFNAVLDGIDRLLVTGETAVGKYPVEVISCMRQTADKAAEYLEHGFLL